MQYSYEETMKAAKFLCFLDILALISMAEARLFRRKDRANPRSTDFGYRMTDPEKIHRQLSNDLSNGQIVEFGMVSNTLQIMLDDLLDLLPKMPSTVIHPGTNIPIADMRVSNVKVPHRTFRVLGVGNYTRTPAIGFFSLSFNALILMVVFHSDRCQVERESRLPCTLVYSYENMTVSLRIYWSLQKPRRILRASILNAEPGSIRTKLDIENQKSTVMNNQKGSPSWTIIMNATRSLIPKNSQLDDLVKAFAEKMFA